MVEHSAIVRQVRSWLFEDAFPFWAEKGVDRVHGGFVERLSLRAEAENPGFKRTRVTGRQIYVFSQASLLGFQPGANCAKHGYDFLISKTWMGREKGWARTVRTDGTVLDATADLYDNAFALYALGWYYRLSGDQSAMEYAFATLDFLDRNMRQRCGGFLHEMPSQGWRQQNPHMHLLEAALSNFEASRHSRFAELALELIELFRTRIFDWTTGTLPEFFENDWQKAAGPDGRITEPGHQFEWVWILQNAKRLLNVEVDDIAQALLASANRHGICARTGATFNQVRDDGQLLDGGSRSWPNTERIKAAIAEAELWGNDPYPVIEEAAKVLFTRHLNVEQRGTWMDAFDASWGQNVAFIPASTLYHVVLAFAEILRYSESRPVAGLR